ncbi:MAG: peptide chain release factor H [Cellvibrionaceae bacterium]
METKHKKSSVLWLQLTAGQGPKECGWVIAQLSRVLLSEAYSANLSAEIVESLAFDKLLRNQTLIEPDAFLSILIRLEGKGIDGFAHKWQGTIKWQGKSPYRPKHKRINWFAGIATLTMLTNNNKTLNELAREVNIETMRSKGPGGQHVNKTNSAVRITHRTTGLKVRVESDRSQHRNKQIALERLQLLLESQSDLENKSLEHSRWLQHYEVQRGNPIHTFYGHEFIERKN